jgi:Cu-Zn family superoxide dismutase
MKRVALMGAMGLAIVAAVVGCKHHDDHATMSGAQQHDAHAALQAGKETADMMKPVTKAIAVLHPTQGNQAKGTVRFTQEGKDGVKVVADLTGLTPNSSHGFHIHEFGDCSAPDATSAGGHYNPGNHPHAGPDAEHRHAGDMGNVKANEQGNAHLEITLKGLTVGNHPNPILGRAVILHAKADDLKSQPTGDAGARIACGVIGAAK